MKRYTIRKQVTLDIDIEAPNKEEAMALASELSNNHWCINSFDMGIINTYELDEEKLAEARFEAADIDPYMDDVVDDY